MSAILPIIYAAAAAIFTMVFVTTGEPITAGAAVYIGLRAITADPSP